MEGKGTDMRIRYFNAYSPKALAAINKLAGTLEDRAFRIVMEKKTVEDRVERFNLKKVESETEALRDELYLWSLRNAEDVADLYGKADEFPGLEALGDRQKDILEPLLSIALAIDGEVEDGGPMTMFERLRSLAIDLNKGKEERDKATESIPAAVAILRDQMDGKEELFLTKDSLLEKLREDDALSFLESKSHLTKFMRNLDVYPIHKREGLGRVRGYSFTKDKVADWAKRYL
jgi:hypothetical protein